MSDKKKYSKKKIFSVYEDNIIYHNSDLTRKDKDKLCIVGQLITDIMNKYNVASDYIIHGFIDEYSKGLPRYKIDIDCIDREYNIKINFREKTKKRLEESNKS